MKKHDENARDDLKYTGSTQDLDRMLSEAVFKAQNDVLNEVFESQQRRWKRLYISILKHFGIGRNRRGKLQKSNKKATSKLHMRIKKEALQRAFFNISAC